MNTFLVVIFLVLFVGCFVGAVIGSITGIETISIACALGIFALIFIAILVDKLIKTLKVKKIAKNGKKAKVRVAGATFGGRKEVNIGSRHQETLYFYPTFYYEDMFGNRKYFKSVKTVTGEDLQKLVCKGEVNVTYIDGYCKIDEDLKAIEYCGTAPYVGKNMVLDENNFWQPQKVGNKKNKEKNKQQGLTIYKVAITILSIINLIVFAGAIFFIYYGIITEQYSVIVGAVITIALACVFDLRILKNMVDVLLVNKKGKECFAKSFKPDVVYYHSTNAGSSTNYVVHFTFQDESGKIRDASQYVVDNVYYLVNSMDRLPIKVYKNHAALNLDKIL